MAPSTRTGPQGDLLKLLLTVKDMEGALVAHIYTKRIIIIISLHDGSESVDKIRILADAGDPLGLSVYYCQLHPTEKTPTPTRITFLLDTDCSTMVLICSL